MVFVETSFPRGGVSKPVKESVSITTPNIVSLEDTSTSTQIMFSIAITLQCETLSFHFLIVGIRCGHIQTEKGKA